MILIWLCCKPFPVASQFSSLRNRGLAAPCKEHASLWRGYCLARCLGQCSPLDKTVCGSLSEMGSEGRFKQPNTIFVVFETCSKTEKSTPFGWKSPINPCQCNMASDGVARFVGGRSKCSWHRLQSGRRFSSQLMWDNWSGTTARTKTKLKWCIRIAPFPYEHAQAAH